MKIFATLYLDEDVPVVLAKLLATRTYDAITARDAGMLRRQDDEQLAYAVSLERCVLTHNREDFEKLHTDYVAMDYEHFGIIIATRDDVYKLARKASALLNSLTADEIANQLFYISSCFSFHTGKVYKWKTRLNPGCSG